MIIWLNDFRIPFFARGYQFARARYVQRPFASCFQLTQIKRKLSGALKAAYEGALMRTRDVHGSRNAATDK